MNNYAFIDGQNLYLGIKDNGWEISLKKFRIYLREKYHVTKAFYFIGKITGKESLYKRINKSGYIMVFKPTVPDGDNHFKGNCDADLVLNVMLQLNNFDNAIIVSGDGDYYSLVKYLGNINKLGKVIAPNHKVAWILRSSAKGNIDYLDGQGIENKIGYKKKRGTP